MKSRECEQMPYPSLNKMACVSASPLCPWSRSSTGKWRFRRFKCFDLNWCLYFWFQIHSRDFEDFPSSMKPVGQGSGRVWIHFQGTIKEPQKLGTNAQEAYGDQRLWSAVGWGTMAFVAGKLMDWKQLQICLPKRLCKRLNIDLIQTFANSRIAKDEMEIDNGKFLPRSF